MELIKLFFNTLFSLVIFLPAVAQSGVYQMKPDQYILFDLSNEASVATSYFNNDAFSVYEDTVLYLTKESTNPSEQTISFEFTIDLYDGANNKGMMDLRSFLEEGYNISFNGDEPITLNPNHYIAFKGQWGTETDVYFISNGVKYDLKDYLGWLENNSLRTTDSGLEIRMNFNNDCHHVSCQVLDDVYTSRN